MARALQAKAHPVVLQDVVAKRLRDEFELQSLSGGLKAVALPQPEVAIVKPLSGPGHPAAPPPTSLSDCPGSPLRRHCKGTLGGGSAGRQLWCKVATNGQFRL